MKLKLVAAVSALAIPALAHAEQSGRSQPEDKLLTEGGNRVPAIAVLQSVCIAPLPGHAYGRGIGGEGVRPT